MERIGFIRDHHLEELKKWCRSQADMVRSSSTYVAGNRREKWFDKGWLLSKQVEIFDAPTDERIYQLGQRLFPGNHSCLFLHYEKGSYIKPHRDHTASENKVVQVNVGCSVFFEVNGLQHLIKDGEVISFDSKLLHGTTPPRAERWAISWRKIKPQYLHQQLTLISAIAQNSEISASKKSKQAENEIVST